MNSRHLVDPELLAVLDAQPYFDLTPELLPGLRAAFAGQLAALPVPQGQPITVKQMVVPGPAGSPPVRIVAYRPTAPDGVLPAILHIHGGGYIFGQPEMNDADNRAHAIDFGCAIFSVDYRLAPETPHPGPVEDCYAALAYLHAHAAELRIDPTRIGIKGESAGGGLAAALALLARDRGEIPVAFQHLTYPMIDDRTCTGANSHPFAGEFVWTQAYNLFGWTSLLGTMPGGPDVSPYAAASRATSLAGLPPTYLSVGALDLFLEENLEYARRLTRDGVPVEFHLYPGAFHGFQLNPLAAVTIKAERDSRAALRQSLHAP